MISAHANDLEVAGVPFNLDGANLGNGALSALDLLGRGYFGEQYADPNGSDARITPASQSKSATPSQMKWGSFLAELKRRDVYKVAIAYIVASWALAQGIAQVLPVFDVSTWAIRLIVILMIIGFPVAVILAWAFDITPDGIKRTADISSDAPSDVTRQLEARARQEFIRGYLFALIYAGLGDKAKAIDCLKREYLNQDNIDALSMRVDPMVDLLHGDLRFETIADKTPETTRIGIEPTDTDNTATGPVGLISEDAVKVKPDLAVCEKNGGIHRELRPLNAMSLDEMLKGHGTVPEIAAEA